MGSDLFKRVSFRTGYKYAIWEDYVIICKVSNEYLGFAVWSKILQEFSSDNELIFPITNNILYLIYPLATLIILPFIYAGGESGTAKSRLSCPGFSE